MKPIVLLIRKGHEIEQNMLDLLNHGMRVGVADNMLKAAGMLRKDEADIVIVDPAVRTIKEYMETMNLKDTIQIVQDTSVPFTPEDMSILSGQEQLKSLASEHVQGLQKDKEALETLRDLLKK